MRRLIIATKVKKKENKVLETHAHLLLAHQNKILPKSEASCFIINLIYRNIVLSIGYNENEAYNYPLYQYFF